MALHALDDLLVWPTGVDYKHLLRQSRHALDQLSEKSQSGVEGLATHWPGISIVHLDRRLWHRVQAGYLWDRYGRAVFILNSFRARGLSASFGVFPDGS